MESRKDPKPRFPRLLSRPFKHSSGVKLKDIATPSSKHMEDIAWDKNSPPLRKPTKHIENIARDQSLPPLKKQGRKGSVLKLLSKVIPCATSKGHALELDQQNTDGVQDASYDGRSNHADISPIFNNYQPCPIQTSNHPVSFDDSTRVSVPRRLPSTGKFHPSSSPVFAPSDEQYWISPRRSPAQSRGDRTPPSFTSVGRSPPASVSSGGASSHDAHEVDNLSIVEDVAGNSSISGGVPEDSGSVNTGDKFSHEEETPTTKLSWTRILAAMKENLSDDPTSLPADQLRSILSAAGLALLEKEPAVEEMSLFQLNQVVTSRDERDAQMVMDWSVIHPEALGFLSAFPALTRLVDFDPQNNELVNPISFRSTSGDMVIEDNAARVEQAADSVDSLSVYSQQTSPSHSSELVPQLMFTLPTESDLTREHVGEEEIPAPELLNTTWVATPKPVMRQRRVYSATPAKRRGVSRLRKVASAPDLQLVAAGSGFDDSDDEGTIATSRDVSGDHDVGHHCSPQIMLGSSLMADTSLGSFSSNRGRVSSVLGARAGFDDFDSAASVSVPGSVFVSHPADDDSASVSGFVSAPSSPLPDGHFVSSPDSRVYGSIDEAQGRDLPVGDIYGPLDMASLRSQMNKVEEIIIANKRASVSAPGTPVVKPGPKDPRDSKARRRGSMGYKPCPISGIRPLMLPMRVALRNIDDDGSSKTVTHPPGTVAPADASARNIVPF
ncbi:hypothetical protein CVT25_000055 [Psilocybe cyanescens]|uniref:Uncharacterized protein n=1 Tax=Psilocybe cyanescens TaxID=93625 RepID=A0A409X8P4_PSICY|nr:hypothetical protein CVT25_000055 [Psilocybe cyanescens]